MFGPAVMALTSGCASPYPAVLTSTSEKVAIEFEADGSLAEASKLAEQECARFGKKADFASVDMTATPSTRIARFTCVSDAPAAAPAAPATEAMPETAEPPTSE
jgi:hypothetical protein